MAVKVIFLTTTGAGTWTKPADWSDVNTVTCIGGGGGGRTAAAAAAAGGGGGACSTRSNITGLGSTINFSVGTGGGPGTAGGDTWFGATTLASSLVGAKGGSGLPAARQCREDNPVLVSPPLVATDKLVGLAVQADPH